MRTSLRSRLRLPNGSEGLAGPIDLDKPLGLMRRGYFLALSILALLVLANYLIINAMIQAQTHAVALTEIVTSQRASLRRVAQIVELVLRTQEQSAGGAHWLVDTRAELVELADRLDANRQAFDLALNKDQGVLVRWLSGPLIDAERAQRLGQMSQEAAQHVRRFAALDANQVQWRFSVWAPIELALASEGPLLSEVSNLSSELYRHAVERAQHFQRLHLLLAVFSLLTLMAEYLLIFRPILRRLRQRNQRITQITDQLRHQASHDLLTGAGNRLLLQQVLQKLGQGDGQIQSHALFLLDVDGFKTINDLFGHAAGDHALQVLSARLKASLGADDELFRTGGDEFTVVVVPAPRDAQAMQALAAGLRDEINKPIRFELQEFQLRAAIGGAALSATSVAGGDLLKQADFALRAAKLSGPGGVRIFDGRDASLSAARELQAQQLSKALPQGQIKAYYQPIVDIHSRRIEGVEALARWHTDEGQVLQPADFLPTLEEFGMLDQLTVAIMQAVVADRMAWRSQGVMPGFVSVNFPEVTLADKGLLWRLQAMAGREGLEWLQIEVLETVLLSRSTDMIERNLHELARQGAQVALDDFGMGYASLNHLRSFPCTSIKIDRSFVAAMLKDSGTLLIVRGMIDIALGLGLKVTVEGIENMAQHEVFTVFPEVRGQGRLYGEVLSAQGLSQLLQQASRAIEGEGKGGAEA